MKCSDCELWKTDECKLNPDAKDLDYGDFFACFVPRGQVMMKERERAAKPRGHKKKIAGIICMLVGLPIVIIASVHIYLSGGGWVFSGGYPRDVILLFIAILGLIVSVPVAVTGAILFFVGRSQEKKDQG